MMSSGPLLYLDTSALARLYTSEPGREEVRREQAAAGGTVAHLITYAEMRSALAGRLRRKALTKRAYTAALGDFERDWTSFEHVLIDEPLMRAAGDLAERHGLRAYDAVHLAAAVTLRPLGVRFMTFDGQLRAAAELELPGRVVS